MITGIAAPQHGPTPWSVGFDVAIFKATQSWRALLGRMGCCWSWRLPGQVWFLALGSSSPSLGFPSGFSKALLLVCTQRTGKELQASSWKCWEDWGPEKSTRERAAHLSPRAQIQRRQNHGSQKATACISFPSSLYRWQMKGSGNRPPVAAPPESAPLGFLASTVVCNSGPQIGVLTALKTSQREPWTPYDYFLHFQKPKRPPCIIN